jgi:hypothetical protein
MDKNAFEAAIREAIDASPNNGAKWRPFEKLFKQDGLRGGGAITNQAAEQGTRVRQLFTLRPFDGVKQQSQYCILVLNDAQAKRHIAEPQKVEAALQNNILNERSPYLPPTSGMESVLILRADNNGLFPVMLLKWGNSPMTNTFSTWYPQVKLVDLSHTLKFNTESERIGESHADTDTPHAQVHDEVIPGTNTIYFGPPGTGKSYRIKEATVSFQQVLHTAFHPEYSYSDFIGSYKPVTGSDPSLDVISFDGTTSIKRPIIYYSFDPGVFIKAVVQSIEAAGAPVALVIDEINRGDCAAIFGDFMHLLDRSDTGRSEYGLDVNTPLASYLVSKGVLESTSDKLYIPSNLHLLATMNTSDQALFPMDSAFKRRWSWLSVPVVEAEGLTNAHIPQVGTCSIIPWLDFITWLNNLILDLTDNEDKCIGPWFIKSKADIISANDVRNKLLYFLWHDVFRSRRSDAFKESLRTFQSVQAAFDIGGLAGIFADIPAFGNQVPDDNGELTGDNQLTDSKSEA